MVSKVNLPQAEHDAEAESTYLVLAGCCVRASMTLRALIGLMRCCLLLLAYRLILSHMSELDPDGTCHVSLKHLVAAVQPVHQAVQQLTSSTSWQKQQAVQQFLHAEAYSPVEAAAAVDVGQTARKQQQLQGASQVEQSNVNSTQWDLPKPPSPVRLIPRPATGSSSSSKAGGSSSVHSDAGTGGLVVAVECDQEVPPVLWPMQVGTLGLGCYFQNNRQCLEQMQAMPTCGYLVCLPV